MVKGGLRLKREVATHTPLPPSGPFTAAHVWVDSSVYHLDYSFTYLIPGNLAEQVVIGSSVIVPFQGRELSALVIGVDNPKELSNLKSILKVVGRIPLITPEIIELIRESAERFASHPFDLLRSALPDRRLSLEKEVGDTSLFSSEFKGSGLREYLQLPPAKDRSVLIAHKIDQERKTGGVLVILPDHREVQALSRELTNLAIEHVALDSHLTPSDYYSRYLSARIGRSSVVIGTRSAIFTPVSELSSIIIFNEGSEHFWERRAPGWNVRDIALLRVRDKKINLFFVGYSPSIDISRLIESKWMTYRRARAKIKVSTYSQSFGELLPSRALQPLKKALAQGPILFIVPLKGYAQAIRCSKCRTISRCECGGALIKKSAQEAISCIHCLKRYPQWQCSWCHSDTPSLQSRGIDRHSHELGALFPNIPIINVSADHPHEDIVESGIVIATPGMAPKTPQGYRSVVILEGNRFLSQADLRAGERTREMYFSHAGTLHHDGTLILIQEEGHPISTALTTWNPTNLIASEMQERSNLSLPPFVRSALITIEAGEVERLKSALSIARDEGRLPSSVKILGPIPSGEKASLILTVEISAGSQLIAMVHEFMRRRSASKKSLPALRIDPYSLAP